MQSEQHCPYSEREVKKETPLHVREERYAQRLLNNPAEGGDILLSYAEHLENLPHIQLMAERDPRQAIHYINRHLRRIPFASLSTIAYTRVLHEFVPLLESGKTLCQKPMPSEVVLGCNNFARKIRRKEDVLTGTTAAFAYNMLDLLGRAWDDTLRVIRDPSSHFNGVWECFEATNHALYYINPLMATPDLQIPVIIEDNARLSLKLLTSHRYKYMKEQAQRGQDPTTYGATTKALRNADVFSWLAEIKSRSLTSLLDKEAALWHNFALLEEYPFDEFPEELQHKKDMFNTKGPVPGLYGVNLRSLMDGPVEHPGFCPAPIMLRMPAEADQAIMRRFRQFVKNFQGRYATKLIETAEAEMLADADKALMNQAEVLMQIGAFIAQETLFEKWPDNLTLASYGLPGGRDSM